MGRVCEKHQRFVATNEACPYCEPDIGLVLDECAEMLGPPPDVKQIGRVAIIKDYVSCACGKLALYKGTFYSVGKETHSRLGCDLGPAP